jgi:hypothetical protein
METVDVSVIIVNYNSLSLVIDCIKSIVQRTKKCTYEIIVVDNDSQKECTEVLSSFFGNSVKCLQLDSNVGFGRANNEGVKISNGRNVLFLNPDTIIVNDALSIMCSLLDTQSNVGACGGNLINESYSPTRSYRCCYPGISSILGSMLFSGLYESLRYGKSSSYNYTTSEKEVAYVVGADLMVPKEILLKFGAFNPAFFMYYEEIELCFRIKKNGYKIINTPKSVIQHLEGKSSGNIEWKAKMHFLSSREFYIQSYSKGYYTVVKQILKIMAFQRILVASILNKPATLSYWQIFNKLLYNQ